MSLMGYTPEGLVSNYLCLDLLTQVVIILHTRQVGDLGQVLQHRKKAILVSLVSHLVPRNSQCNHSAFSGVHVKLGKPKSFARSSCSRKPNLADDIVEPGEVLRLGHLLGVVGAVRGQVCAQLVHHEQVALHGAALLQELQVRVQVDGVGHLLLHLLPANYCSEHLWTE